MAKLHHRAFAGFFAALFLVTSSATTILVIYLATKGDNSSSQTKQTQPPKEEKMDNFTPTTEPQTELKIIDTTEGTGEAVKPGDTVTADYTGAVMATGVVFDSSSKSGKPATFPLANVIQGWQEGVPGMKVGGTRRLLIPAAMAYGANPPAGSGIPANADLVFDITLRKIGQ